MRSAVVLLGFAGLWGAAPSTAHAQAAAKAGTARPSDPPKDRRAPAIDVKPLLGKLRSGDESEIKAALDDARLAGPPAAGVASAIGDLLLRGLSLPVAQSACETLGDLESEAGSPALVEYATHRDPKVRRAAVKALTRTRGAAAGAALRRALSDSDAVVRGTAASGLGALKVKDAVPELFLALEHRVNEAAASIGQVCVAAQCEPLAAKLGKLPFDVVTSGLDPLLFRPSAEVSDDAKVAVVERVQAQGTIEGHKFLRDVQRRAAAAGLSARLRMAIDRAVTATAGGAQ
jgi:HEAT repeat protein